MKDFMKIGNPPEFWNYFYEISRIPRCSQKEEKIREYVKIEAEKLKLETQIDEVGNIVVRIPDGEKKRIVLQSHMDMVCEKNNEVEHDFSKDPIQLKVVNIDGEKWLTADGTTLGADNAVGMAYQLAIMKRISDGSLNLGPYSLDLLFTVDEERGLSGASQMDVSMIKGDYLLNLDSEEDNEFTIGCAGGRVFIVNIEKVMVKEKIFKGKIPIKISISGLIGGHSGIDINKGRANALKILSEILWKINSHYYISINDIEGGNLSNAIPREASSIIFIKQSEKYEIISLINNLKPNISALYEGIEPELTIKVEDLRDFSDQMSFESDLKDKILNFFNIMPTGPVSLHPTSKGLVHTSLNFAAIKTLDDKIEVKVSTRSLTEYDKDNLFERIKTLLQMSGLKYDLEIETVYPSWAPNFNSDLVKISERLYNDLFNDSVVVKAIHAGLECAFFSKFYPKMQMISFGPDIIGGHSPDERVRITSIEKIWKFLIELLKELGTIS